MAESAEEVERKRREKADNDAKKLKDQLVDHINKNESVREVIEKMKR
jgi:hypothetical protein